MKNENQIRELRAIITRASSRAHQLSDRIITPVEKATLLAVEAKLDSARHLLWAIQK